MARKLVDAPMAVTTAGRVLVSMTHLTTKNVDPREALEQALAGGRPVYIGVELTEAETKASLKMLDDAFAEIAAVIGYLERG
jgi:hypothetical protein